MGQDAARAEDIFCARWGIAQRALGKYGGKSQFFVVQHSEDAEVVQAGSCLPDRSQRARLFPKAATLQGSQSSSWCFLTYGSWTSPSINSGAGCVCV